MSRCAVRKPISGKLCDHPHTAFRHGVKVCLFHMKMYDDWRNGGYDLDEMAQEYWNVKPKAKK